MNRVFLFDINKNIVELLQGDYLKWDLVCTDSEPIDLILARGQDPKFAAIIYLVRKDKTKIKLWEDTRRLYKYMAEISVKNEMGNYMTIIRKGGDNYD